MNAANHIRYRLWVDGAIDINSHSGVLLAAIPYHATLIGANGVMSMLLFFTRNDSTYLHKMKNTSKIYGRMGWNVVKYVSERSHVVLHSA